MSNFKTVAGFLKAVPRAMQHKEEYRDYVAHDPKLAKEEIDLAVLEFNALGVGERNLLRDLIMDNKFIKKDMDEEFEIESGSFAKQVEKVAGKGSLSHTRSYKETFLMENTVYLTALNILVADSQRPGLQVPNNEPLYKELMSALRGIAPGQMSGVALAFVGERLVCRQDMRKVFLKGYLMLQSYNLAISSGRKKYRWEQVNATSLASASAGARVSQLMRARIVADVRHFTHEELWFLAEMCDEYPKKRFEPANIYNNISVEADELVWLSDKTFKAGKPPGYGSPERMWFSLVNIALKFGAMDDLMEVVQDFRGLPMLFRTVSRWTGRWNYELSYPHSYSIRLGVEGCNPTMNIIQRTSGYLATTKSLVADILLGRMMEMATFTMLEELGAVGTLGVPSADPVNDKVFNSNLRNWGVKSDDEEDNSLLQEWKSVKGGKIPVSFNGRLKAMAVNMVYSLWEDKADWLRPQLLFAIPYSSCTNTTWGSIRGWKFPDFDVLESREKRLRENGILKAYTWVMGVSKDVPKVGINAFGIQLCEVLSDKELEFMHLAAGDYKLQLVRHRMKGGVAPRTDEIEVGPDIFYSSAFPGTRCTIIFDMGGEPTLEVDSRKEGEFDVTSVICARDTRVKRATYGGSAMRKNGDPNLRTGAFGEQDEDGTVDENLLNGRDGDDDGNNNDDDASQDGEEDDGNKSDNGDEVAEQEKKEKEKEREKEKEKEKRKDKRDDRRKKASEVKVSRPPLAVFRESPRQRYDMEGRPIPVETELTNGEKLFLVEGANKDMPEGGSISGYVLKTPGDGLCGIHSVIQDLHVRRFVDDAGAEKMYSYFSENTASNTFHEMSEIAAVCNTLNLGFVCLDADNKNIHRFGTRDSTHNIWTHWSGNHYSTFIPNPSGKSKFVDYTYVNGNLTVDASILGIKLAEDLLGGNRVVDRLIEKMRARTFVGSDRSGRTPLHGGRNGRGGWGRGGRGGSAGNTRNGRDYWMGER